MKHASVLIVLAIAFTHFGCTSNQPAKDKVYDIKGKVVSIDADKKKITLDHEEIPGAMKAMTMPFSVEDAKVLDAVKTGDAVQGRVKRTESAWTILELKKQ